MFNLLFVQTGDYKSAYQNFANGGAETYRDQIKSVDYVASLATKGKVTTVSLGQERYHTELAPNLWAIGLDRSDLKLKDVEGVFEDVDPSHLILRTPNGTFLREALIKRLSILPSFADIFIRKGIRSFIHNYTLSHQLRQCPIVCNHSLNASRSLVSVLKVRPEKVVSWDWSKIPMAGAAKTSVNDATQPTAFFAGAVTESKGVGDCLKAIAELQSMGCRMSMTFAGHGNIGQWETQVEELGILDRVQFLGVIPNSQVRQEMRNHDFVIVPSRHVYDEGLPNTIYEGLASRSVLIISDHPAFAGRLKDGEEALVFTASDPKSLASCLKRAIGNNDLYRKLSENSERAHDSLYVGMEWTELIDAFLADPTGETGWVAENSLAAWQQ